MPLYRSTKNILLQDAKSETPAVAGTYVHEAAEFEYDLSDAEAKKYAAALIAEGAREHTTTADEPADPKGGSPAV